MKEEESESYVKVKEPFIVKRSDPVQKEFTETYEVTGIPYINTNYDSSINENTIFTDILTNKKVEYLLFRYLDYFKSLKFGNLKHDLEYEHVFFCFEMFPHIESILKHNVFILGEDFSHTIVCCKYNENYIRTIVSGFNIKVVCLNYETMFMNDYNNECLSKDFYKNFSGNYLYFTNPGGLIKEKPDLNKLKQYDFCGQTNNNIFSENYSFRNKNACINLLDMVDNYSIENTTIEKIKKEFHLEKIPENIFFGNLLLHNSLNLSDNVFVWKSFFKIQVNDNNLDMVCSYLEKVLGIYF